MTTPEIIRVPCDYCQTTGEVVSKELGRYVVCSECMGHGYLSETPQPHAPQADVRQE